MEEKMIRNILEQEDGFNLVELLVVIIIIGILVLLAMPRFSSVVSKAKETEAKIMLDHIHTLQQAYYFENDTYANDLAALGFEQEQLVTNGGTARYKIEIINANAYEYSITATAVVDFDKDGTFNIWAITQEGRPKQSVPD
jgi:type IV pilus assembly protein PilE